MGDSGSDLVPETAEIQALTAQVRVLMVGSRQVTMSVFNQLDCVDLEEVVPMGRVQPRGDGIDRLWMIGANSSGELVRACLFTNPPPGVSFADPWTEMWKRKINSLPLIVLAGLR